MSGIRELTANEIGHVSGGPAPIVVFVAIQVTRVVVQRVVTAGVGKAVAAGAATGASAAATTAVIKGCTDD